MKSKWESEKETLQRLIVEEKVSYEEIGRRYNCSGANIKKVALRLGIELVPRRSINDKETFNKKEHKCLCCGKLLDTNRKYCDSNCQKKYASDLYIKRWKEGLEKGYDARYKISTYVRSYILEKNNYTCEKCGCNLINPYTGLSILQIHHINGDASNASESNLQLLCPNCHAMTENFGSRNDSSVREHRKEDYKKFESSIKDAPLAQ